MGTQVRPPEPVYVSGPMSYYPHHNMEAFREVCNQLREQGLFVNSPHEVEAPEDILIDSSEEEKWQYFMRHDIALLLESKSVVVLHGWECSRGARLEVYIAHALGMPVVPHHLIASPDPRADG